jgi:hypothetical protein
MERRGSSVVTAALVVLLGLTCSCSAERLSRRLQESIKGEPVGNVGAAAVKKVRGLPIAALPAGREGVGGQTLSRGKP